MKRVWGVFGIAALIALVPVYEAQARSPKKKAPPSAPQKIAEPIDPHAWKSCEGSPTSVSIPGCTIVINAPGEAESRITQAYFYRGKAYNLKNDVDHAIADFNEVIRRNPQHLKAFLERGAAYRVKRQYERALADFNHVIELNSNYTEAYNTRGWYYRERNPELAGADFNKALTLSNQAIEQKIDLAENLNRRAEAYAGKDENDRALDDLNQAINLKPENIEAHANRATVYYNKGDIDRAIELFDETLKREPDYQAVIVTRGYAHNAKNQHALAIADFTRALSLYPQDADAYNMRGVAYHNSGDVGSAIVNYSEAIRLQSDHPIAYLNRGAAYSDRSEYDLAIADYSRAIEITPKNTHAYAKRCIAYVAKGEHERALADMTSIIRLKPDDAEAYYRRGSIFVLLSDKDQSNADRAIEDLSTALRLQPEHANALAERGQAYNIKGDATRALADLDQAVNLKPREASIHVKRARFHKIRKDYNRAIIDYSEANVLEPGVTYVVYERGTTFAEKQDFISALADFTEVIASKAKQDDAYIYLSYFERAKIYGHDKQYDRAIADLSEITNGSTQSVPVWLRRKALAERARNYHVKLDLEQALADFSQAIRLDKDDADALAERAWLYNNYDMFAPAISDLNELLRVQPNNGWAYAERGWAHRKSGNFVQAISDFDQALRFTPDDAVTNLERARAQEALQESAARVRNKTAFTIMPISGHMNIVSAVAFSPDGKYAVTGGEDKALRLWDVATGRLLQVLEDHTNKINAIAFSPNSMQIASASWDGSVKLWDITNGTLVRTYNTMGPALAVAFSPDGNRLLAGSNRLKLWDTKSDQLIRTFEGDVQYINAVAFSRDGTRVLSANSDNSVRVWDTASGRLLHNLTGHTEVVKSLAISPDGLQVLTGGVDRTLKLWDVNSGALLRTQDGKTDFNITSLCFSPDGKRILVQNGLNTELRNAADWKVLQTIGSEQETYHAAFSLDGTRILTGGFQEARLWDAATGQLQRTFGGRFQPVQTLSFSRDGKHLLVGGASLQLWDAKTGQLVRRSYLKGYSPIGSVAFSPDANLLVGAMGLWDASGQHLRTLEQSFHKWTAMSPDGSQLVSFGNSAPIVLWNAQTGEKLRIFDGHSETVTAVAFSPDGKNIVSAGADIQELEGTRLTDQYTLKLWDVATGKLLRTYSGHADHILSVAFSPDGKQLLSGGRDGNLRLWDVATGNGLKTLDQVERAYHNHYLPPDTENRYIRAVGFSPDGKKVMSAFGRTVRLWDAQSGNLLRTFVGSPAHVNTAAFSSDGTRIASGSSDGRIIIWDADSGMQLVSLFDVTDGEWVAMTPAGFVNGSPQSVDMFSIIEGQTPQPLSKYYEQLHRPDLVEEALKGDLQGKHREAAKKFNFSSDWWEISPSDMEAVIRGQGPTW